MYGLVKASKGSSLGGNTNRRTMVAETTRVGFKLITGSSSLLAYLLASSRTTGSRNL